MMPSSPDTRPDRGDVPSSPSGAADSADGSPAPAPIPLPDFDFITPDRRALDPHTTQTPRQIPNQITRADPASPRRLRVVWGIAALALASITLITVLYRDYTLRTQAREQRQEAIRLMQDECMYRCTRYGTTLQALGEPIKVSQTHKGESFDSVYEWHAPDLSLTLHLGQHLHTFNWLSTAPKRSRVDVSLKLHQVDYALSQVIASHSGDSQADLSQQHVTLRFLIAPDGRAYDVAVLHDASDNIHNDFMDEALTTIIVNVDFGAGHYAPLDQRYTVSGPHSSVTSQTQPDDDE